MRSKALLIIAALVLFGTALAATKTSVLAQNNTMQQGAIGNNNLTRCDRNDDPCSNQQTPSGTNDLTGTWLTKTTPPPDGPPAFQGIFTFAGPVAGRFYLSGDLQAVSIISEATGTSNPAALAIGGVSVLFSVLGAILFSKAIWRSDKLPKWSAFAYAISAPLNWIPHYIPAFWFLGGILLFGAGIAIARGIWTNS